MRQEASRKEFLRISTELQSELIVKLFEKTELPNMLGHITERVGSDSKDLSADACSIYIVEKEPDQSGETYAYMQAASGYQKEYVGAAKARILDPDSIPEGPQKDEELGVTGWVISTGRAFLARTAEELSHHPHWSGRYDSKQLPSRAPVTTYLAVPLRDPRGRIIGALKAERLGREEPFSVADQLVLETLARVAGRCIVYTDEAQGDSVNAAVTLWAREVIAEAVAAEGELDSFLDMVAKVIAASTRADSCAIFHVDQERRTLTQRAGSGAQALRDVVRSYNLPEEGKIGECIDTRICRPDTCKHRREIPWEQRVGLTAWMAATGKSFHASNRKELEKHCHHRGDFDEHNYKKTQECGAWLGVPLQVGGATIGVLKVENVHVIDQTDDNRDFDEEDQRRLDLLAQDVALAIERLQLQYRTRYQVIEEAMPTILEILRGELDVDRLVRRVVEETANLFEARACALFLKEGNELIQRAAVGWSTLGPPRKYRLVDSDEIKEAPTEDEKVGLTVWIAVTGKMFTAKSNKELRAHAHHRGVFDPYNFKKKERCESFMGIPLMVAGHEGGESPRKELVGVLKVETKMRKVGDQPEFAYFTELDELAFTLMANSAAIAIQNARLLESRRLAERILAMPDANEVMRELYEFIEGRVDVIATLSSTADAVTARDKSKLKASIVSQFSGVLSRDFDIAILEQLANSVQDPIRGFLRGLALAIQAPDLDHIRTLQDRLDELVDWATVLGAGFFLNRCAKRFVDDLRTVSKLLEAYDRDPRQRAALELSRERLTKALEQVEQMTVFEKTTLGGVYRRWIAVIQEALQAFHVIENPYLAGPPLAANSPVFVGREETFRWIEEMLCAEGQQNSLFLHGGWHTGKTSILKQLEAGPRGNRLRRGRTFPVFPVFFDIQQILDPGTDSFLLSIADSVASALQDRRFDCPPPDEDEFKVAHGRAFKQFLKRVVQLLDEGLLVLMLDEVDVLFTLVEEGKIDHQVFDYLRSVIQHQPQVSLILVARHSLHLLDEQDRTKLYNVAQHREIGFLGPDEIRQLIRVPVKDAAVTYDDAVVERIERLTGGHPFFIQQLCHYCINRINEQKSGYEVLQEHLDYAEEQCLEPGNVATIERVWSEVGKIAQRVLHALTVDSGECPLWVSRSALLRKMEGDGLDETKMTAAIEKLTAFRLIDRDNPEGASEEVSYRHSVDLMRLWVLRRP